MLVIQSFAKLVSRYRGPSKVGTVKGTSVVSTITDLSLSVIIVTTNLFCDV